MAVVGQREPRRKRGRTPPEGGEQAGSAATLEFLAKCRRRFAPGAWSVSLRRCPTAPSRHPLRLSHTDRQVFGRALHTAAPRSVPS